MPVRIDNHVSECRDGGGKIRSQVYCLRLSGGQGGGGPKQRFLAAGTGTERVEVGSALRKGTVRRPKDNSGVQG